MRGTYLVTYLHHVACPAVRHRLPRPLHPEEVSELCECGHPGAGRLGYYAPDQVQLGERETSARSDGR